MYIGCLGGKMGAQLKASLEPLENQSNIVLGGLRRKALDSRATYEKLFSLLGRVLKICAFFYTFLLNKVFRLP